MALVDDARPFVAGKNVLSVVLVEARVELRDELVDDGLVHQEIVRRYAGLAGVDAFAPGNALGCTRDVRGSVHDAGAFAAQLKRDGREVFRGGGHDGVADSRASREADVVPARLQQPVVHGAGSREGADERRVEQLGQHFAEQRARRTRGARRLERHAVAGGKRVHQRHERKLQGVVPRAEHQDYAVGARIDLRPRTEMRDGRGHAPRARP